MLAVVKTVYKALNLCIRNNCSSVLAVVKTVYKALWYTYIVLVYSPFFIVEKEQSQGNAWPCGC
jgi:hypothetical protein